MITSNQIFKTLFFNHWLTIGKLLYNPLCTSTDQQTEGKGDLWFRRKTFCPDRGLLHRVQQGKGKIHDFFCLLTMDTTVTLSCLDYGSQLFWIFRSWYALSVKIEQIKILQRRCDSLVMCWWFEMTVRGLFRHAVDWCEEAAGGKERAKKVAIRP